MKNKEKKTKEHSNKRKRNRHIFGVRVDDSEYEIIMMNAENTGLSPAGMLRILGTGYKPKSIIDSRHIIELIRLRGDLGRIGGLLKLHVNNSPGHSVSNTDKLIDEICQLKDEIRGVIDQLV